MLTPTKRTQVNLRLKRGEHRKFKAQAQKQRMHLSEWFRELARREVEIRNTAARDGR